MPLFRELTIIFSIYLLGEFIALWIPIAGSIIGMLILLVLLFLEIVKEKDIEIISNFLLENMAFFFIPAGVGVMAYYELVSEDIFSFVSIIFITTFIALSLTAKVVDSIVKRDSK